MVGRIIIVIIGLSIIHSNLLNAQDTASKNLPVQWDLQSCLDYAKKNNILLNSIKLNSQSVEQKLLLAKAAKLPGVSGAASQYYTHSNNTSSVIGGFQTQSSVYGNYSFSTAWVLYNGGYINNISGKAS